MINTLLLIALIVTYVGIIISYFKNKKKDKYIKIINDGISQGYETIQLQKVIIDKQKADLKDWIKMALFHENLSKQLIQERKEESEKE